MSFDEEEGMPFGQFRMVGGRYERPGLPLSSAMELFRYERLLKAVAHHLFLDRHRGRRRVPRGFEDMLELRLTDVERGSVIPVLTRSNVQTDTLFPQLDWYEEARRLINSALGALNQEEPSLPDEFPPAALKEFAQFGRTLQDSEHIELSGEDEEAVYLTTETRRRIHHLAQLDSIEVETVLIGQITGLLSDPQQFHFSDASTGRKLVGLYTDPAMWDVLHDFQGFATRAPLAALSAVAKRGLDGELLSVSDVLGVEAALPPSWAERMELLNRLRNGWYGPDSPAPTAQAMDTAEELLFAFMDEQVPRPGIYPFVDGGVQFEWSTSDREVELTIANDGLIEGFYAFPALDAYEDFVANLDDTESVIQFVRRHVNGGSLD